MTAFANRHLVAALIALSGCTTLRHRDESSRHQLPVFRSDTNVAAYLSPEMAPSFVFTYFGGILRLMGEPPFYGAVVPPEVTVLRFLWLGSFTSDVAVRLLLQRDRCLAVTTILGRPEPKYGPPERHGMMRDLSGARPILRRDSLEVRRSSCTNLGADLTSAVQSADSANSRRLGLDGMVMVFELLDVNGHRAFARWSPDSAEGRLLWPIALRFLQLGRTQPPEMRLR